MQNNKDPNPTKDPKDKPPRNPPVPNPPVPAEAPDPRRSRSKTPNRQQVLSPPDSQGQSRSRSRSKSPRESSAKSPRHANTTPGTSNKHAHSHNVPGAQTSNDVGASVAKKASTGGSGSQQPRGTNSKQVKSSGQTVSAPSPSPGKPQIRSHPPNTGSPSAGHRHTPQHVKMHDSVGEIHGNPGSAPHVINYVNAHLKHRKVAAVSGTGTPVRPSSERRETRQTRVTSPGPPRPKSHMHANPNININVQDAPGARSPSSRSGSPRNQTGSPRSQTPLSKNEQFSTYLQDLHTSLIHRSVLASPKPGASTRELCGNLLASPRGKDRHKKAPWLLLPPEIWMYALSLLKPGDRCSAGLTCKSLYSLATDFTLWTNITVRGRVLTPPNLKSIGNKSPKCISFLQCEFQEIEETHLREFFREVSVSLEELNIVGCSSKECNANTILVHAGTRCSVLLSLDSSWSNLSPHTMVAFAECVNSLYSLSLNGCSAITDACLQKVLEKHGPHLRKLHIFGCFKLDKCLKSIPNFTPNLQVIHFGNIPFVNDEVLQVFATSLKDLREIDIRSSRNVTDEGIYLLAFYCRRLTVLILNNCSQVTDFGMSHLGGYCVNLSVLEVDGCSKLTDEGMVKLLVDTRVMITKLALSSTAVTSATCDVISEHCAKIEEVKLSSCQAKVSIHSLKRMLTACRSLKSVDLYGFDSGRVKKISAVNRDVKINI